jgi:hypothetical protein
MKKLVKECIPMYSAEGKARKFTEDPDVQIHKKAINELGYNNPVDQSGLVVKWAVQDHRIPQAHDAGRITASSLKG